MPLLGRFPRTPTRPAPRVTGLVLVALVFLHGPAFARQAASSVQRRTRSAPRSRAVAQPVDLAAQQARERFRSIEWEEGPETVGLGGIAELKVSRGFVFTGVTGSKVFLDLCRYPAPKELLGILAPSGSFDWVVVFESKAAARPDDVKGKPNADVLLQQLRQENEADNAVRRDRGWAERKNLEWERPPAYDDHTGNLTWATRSDASGQRVIHSVTRMFGGSAAIDAHLVASAEDLARVGPTVANILTLVEFADGANFGARREEQAAAAPNAPASSSSGTTVVYSSGSSAGGARSLARSPRMIGGFLTAFFSALGAAFRKKRSAA